MNETSFTIHLEPNGHKLIRGKRAEIGVYDDWAGEDVVDMVAQIEPLKYPKDASQEYLGYLAYPHAYMAEGIITKSHREGDITIIDEFEYTGVSIVEEENER